MIAAARDYLATVDVASFRRATPEDFRRTLDQVTREFVDCMPRGAKHWGAMRKFLNIFLRNVFYNRYLFTHFELDEIEPWLEVPLDSHVAGALSEEAEGRDLPRWRTVIGLDEATHERFQAVADRVAAREGFARVHLDLLYWRRK